MAEPLSINEQSSAPELLSVDTNTSASIPLPDDVVQRRAANAHYGLSGKIDKTYPDYFNPIANGQEDQLRQEVASNLNYQKTINRYKMIDEFARAKGRPLQPDDIDNLKNFINTPTDPNSVFEQSYSDKYMQTIKNTPGFPGSWYDAANQQIPEAVATAETDSSVYLSKIEYAKKKKEDAEALTSDQSWLGWGLDQAKALVPGYTDVKLRGNVPGAGYFQGGLLGENLEEEAKTLLRLPFPEYKSKFDNIMDGLSKANPSIAAQFARAVEGQSYDEKVLASANTLIDLSSIGGVGKIGKAVLTKAALFNDVRTVNKEMIAASKDVGTHPPGVVAANAAGDVGEAAVQRATADTVKSVQGTLDPIKQSTEALTAVLRTDVEKIKADPGNFGQEIINRISEQAGKFREKLMNAMENISKVERIPAVLATKEALNAIKDDFKTTYRGIQNAIMDIGDVTHNPATNTYNVTMRIGRQNGEWFLSKSEAEGFANANGIVLRGSALPKDKARYAFLKQSMSDAETKLAEYLSEKSINLTTGSEQKFTTAELDKRIESIEKGIPNFQKELDSIPGSPEGAVIKPKGWAFYIEATKPLNETSPVIRDYLLATKGVETPTGWLNSFAGWLRTPDETLSLEQRKNRKVAVYTGSVLLELVKEEAKSIRDLARFSFPGTTKKERFIEWERAVKQSQEAIDPITGDKGYFFRSPREVDDFYRTAFQRGATAPEVEAYFAFTRLIEMDRVMRNRDLYNHMSRLGTESHSLILRDAEGKLVQSDFFHGVVRKEFPGGDDNIMVIGDNLGDKKVGTVNDFGQKRLKQLREGVSSGQYKVIEIYNPDLRPMEAFGLGSERVRYVVTKGSVETKPLPFDLIPRRGGGHFDFDYSHYIKQAKVRPEKIGDKFNHWYEGDTTIMPIANRVVGRDVAEKLDAIRIALKAGDTTLAEQLTSRLPIPRDEVLGWFKEKRGPGGIKIPARISLNEPIQVVPKNKLIGDMSQDLKNRYNYVRKDGVASNSFRDGTREGSLARQFQIEYTGERDAQIVSTINDIGTKQYPLYAYQPAKLIDPIPTMNRSLTKIINSTFMDDYKVFSVEHWLAEAGQYLKEDWRSAPFYHFTNADNNAFKTGTPIEIKSRLLNTRFQIQQFIGIPSKTQALLDSMAQQLADSIYTKYGPGGSTISKALLLAPSWALARVLDPIKFMHSVTYHAVIGLWSIPQLLVQSMTYVTIFGVAGAEKAIPGSLGALLHQYSRLSRNPAILDKLDEIASKLSILGSSRWRPGEFKEAVQELSKTGFDNVAGEHALLDHALSPKVISTGTHDILDAGTMFFKGAERNARYGAWYTAYREFRDLNPTGKITNGQRNGILERAETLAGNMTKASKSSLQMGPMSFPTQFLAYQLRLAELFTGKRLTTIERSRLVATYAAMYGVPTAVGIAGFPLTDAFRKAAIDNGYVVGDNPIADTVMEGLPAALGALVTGGGDMRKGTHYNVGERLGAPGLDVIRETLAGDKPWWNIVGGASFSTFSGAFEATGNLTRSMMSAIRGDDVAYPVMTTDVTDIFKQISTVNNVNRFLVAVNTGNWLSRNEAKLQTEISPEKAFFQSVTGLQPQQSADIKDITVLLKDRKNYEQDLENAFIKEFRRGLRSTEDSPEQGKQFFARAFKILDQGGYPNEKVSSAIAIAIQDNEELYARLENNLYLKNVPEDKKEAMRDAYARSLRVQREKE